MPLPTDLEARCRAKKGEQLSKIPKEWMIKTPAPSILNALNLPYEYGILNAEEVAITELDDVDELLCRLAKGVWSAVAVTTAYCKRAIIAHQLVNCLTEFWIEDAMARAKELDEAFVLSGPVGPLHGLPISLKDQFDVAGKENNMGLASWLGRISDKDATLVTMLRKAGCVLYTRTNIPMTVLLAETVNHVYGRTVDPRNRDLTCGGSSGGECALLALKGSPLGIGTDIGGSIRIPAHMNSLYGLRPTTRHMPYYGASNTMLGQESIESSIGPVSRTLSGCTTLFRTIIDGAPWDYDPKCVGIKWQEDLYQLRDIPHGPSGKLCFGYYDDDGVVRCQPPVRRAVQMTVEALRRAGHTVIPWKPIDHALAISILRRTFAAGVVEEFERLFDESGEPLVPGIDDYPSFPPVTVNRYWQLCEEREAYRKRYLDAILSTAAHTGTGRPIDGIICAVAPFSAPPHDQNIYFGYTGVWNVLDMPSVTIPVGFVDPELDGADTDAFGPRNEIDAKVRAMYTGPARFRDAPVGIQLVGRRWRDEEVLAFAGVIDKVLQARGR